MDDLVSTVVGEACRKDPSLPADTALTLARAAFEAPVDADAPEIARALLAGHDGVDVSWANAVATTVAELR